MGKHLRARTQSEGGKALSVPATTTTVMGIVEKIKDIEHEMSRTQKNKATEGHLGSLKAKLAKLRRELMEVPKKGPAVCSSNADFTCDHSLPPLKAAAYQTKRGLE